MGACMQGWVGVGAVIRRGVRSSSDDAHREIGDRRSLIGDARLARRAHAVQLATTPFETIHDK